MYFTNQNQRHIIGRNNFPRTQIASPILSMAPRFYHTTNVNTKPVVPEKIVETPPQQKKMKWGGPTWIMFHTIAQKVKEESFYTKRLELLNIINMICTNLPCPDCAKHASQYMAGINFNTIQTKEHLKIMLFNFHNIVNARKGFPLFKYEDLDTKYNNANLVQILNVFMVHFEDKHKSIRMIADDLHRARMASYLKTWFIKNLNHFEGFE
jgi:hypothetical protein